MSASQNGSTGAATVVSQLISAQALNNLTGGHHPTTMNGSANPSLSGGGLHFVQPYGIAPQSPAPFMHQQQQTAQGGTATGYAATFNQQGQLVLTSHHPQMPHLYFQTQQSSNHSGSANSAPALIPQSALAGLTGGMNVATGSLIRGSCLTTANGPAQLQLTSPQIHHNHHHQIMNGGGKTTTMVGAPSPASNALGGVGQPPGQHQFAMMPQPTYAIAANGTLFSAACNGANGVPPTAAVAISGATGQTYMIPLGQSNGVQAAAAAPTNGVSSAPSCITSVASLPARAGTPFLQHSTPAPLGGSTFPTSGGGNVLLGGMSNNNNSPSVGVATPNSSQSSSSPLLHNLNPHQQSFMLPAGISYIPHANNNTGSNSALAPPTQPSTPNGATFLQNGSSNQILLRTQGPTSSLAGVLTSVSSVQHQMQNEGVMAKSSTPFPTNAVNLLMSNQQNTIRFPPSSLNHHSLPVVPATLTPTSSSNHPSSLTVIPNNAAAISASGSSMSLLPISSKPLMTTTTASSAPNAILQPSAKFLVPPSPNATTLLPNLTSRGGVPSIVNNNPLPIAPVLHSTPSKSVLLPLNATTSVGQVSSQSGVFSNSSTAQIAVAAHRVSPKSSSSKSHKSASSSPRSTVKVSSTSLSNGLKMTGGEGVKDSTKSMNGGPPNLIPLKAKLSTILTTSSDTTSSSAQKSKIVETSAASRLGVTADKISESATVLSGNDSGSGLSNELVIAGGDDNNNKCNNSQPPKLEPFTASPTKADRSSGGQTDDTKGSKSGDIRDEFADDSATSGQETPKAVVKPSCVMSHSIEGLLVRESSKPFPVSKSDSGKMRSTLSGRGRGKYNNSNRKSSANVNNKTVQKLVVAPPQDSQLPRKLAPAHINACKDELAQPNSLLSGNKSSQRRNAAQNTAAASTKVKPSSAALPTLQHSSKISNGDVKASKDLRFNNQELNEKIKNVSEIVDEKPPQTNGRLTPIKGGLPSSTTTVKRSAPISQTPSSTTTSSPTPLISPPIKKVKTELRSPPTSHSTVGGKNSSPKVGVTSPGGGGSGVCNPLKWKVEDVSKFLIDLPGCSEYIEEFKQQEIDGQALMLLKADHLMSAMSIKLGPALKICSAINEMKENCPQIKNIG